MNENNDFWLLKVVNDRHNHSSTLVDFHSTHRKSTMISEMKANISRQLKMQITLSQILSNLRFSNFAASSSDDSKNSVILNSMFKSRDIYNLKAKLRRKNLESLISIQALIRELNEANWTFAM
jgi:pyruvate dehydrogenase complex dehydrogenase (E1) component